jgi:hypothetical protein
MLKQSGLDYDKLIESLKQKQPDDNKVVADSVRGRMHKIAFDVYSVDNDPYDSLWRLESNADDGKEYLVRMDSDKTEVKTGSWSALSNDTNTSITLYYKDIPVQRLSSKIFGFTNDDVGIFKKALVEKINGDECFRGKIFNMLSGERKNELVKVFPELSVASKK